MYRPTPTPQQVLSHSEVPGFSGLFVLGFQERHVNLYSQQVRALNLALALELDKRLTLDGRMAKDLRKGKKMDLERIEVCVVGGGASGAMAAVALALCGCKVTIFESKERLLPLPDPKLSGTATPNQRTIHPHLMHWPYVTGQHDEAGLPFMSWTAGKIEDVLEQIKNGFDDIKKKRKLAIEERCSTQVYLVRREKLDDQNMWHPTYRVSYYTDKKQNTVDHKMFDLVILATGFGAEKSYPGLPFDSYWKNDWLSELQSRAGSVLVSGIGDGGIEDAIQLALAEVIPIHELAPFLFDRPPISEKLRTSVRALKAWLMDIEEKAHGVEPSKQSQFLKMKWDEGYENPKKFGLEDAFKELRETLKNKRKTASIIITLNASGTSYHSLRSSVVHRLILYCLEKLGSEGGPLIKYVQGQLVADLSEPTDNKYAIQLKEKRTYQGADLFIVRHGPELHFESLKFEPENIRGAIRELRTRNVLDQTRFPMWPIYGNPKRFARFQEVKSLMVKPQDALTDKPEWDSEDPPKDGVLEELVMRLVPSRLDTSKKGPDGGFDPIEFVYVPGGIYQLSHNDMLTPVHYVKLQGFWISRYPITVKQYAEFVENYYHEWPVQLRDNDVRGRLTTRLRKKPTPEELNEERQEFIKANSDHPIADTSWVDAMHYCQWAGFSLPTAAQWEAACTGHIKDLASLHNSPHNQGFSSEHIRYRRTGLMTGACRVKTFEFARSPFGVVQQLGNVWEFCVDSWDENPNDRETNPGAKEFPPDPVTFNDSRQREFRGGSWFDYEHPNVFHRGHNGDRNRNGRDGFRVVWVNPREAGSKEKEHDAIVEDHSTKKIDFPEIENDAEWDKLPKEGTYLATPALRRLHTVHSRKERQLNPSDYLTFGDLKHAFRGKSVDIILGWHNMDPSTEQKFSALSCDAWYISELTEALMENKVQPGHTHTKLAQEVLPTLKDGSFAFSKYKSAIISIGSGAVNAITEKLVEYNIVPGFEQSTNSTIFGQKLFFARPEDTEMHGILVAFKEMVEGQAYPRVVIAGRNGYATAAGIFLLVRQLCSGELEKRIAARIDALTSGDNILRQRLPDNEPVRIIFKVEHDQKFHRPPVSTEWQDPGIPDLKTFELVEPAL